MKSGITGIKKDYIGGALVILLGTGAVAIGRTYEIGKLSRMGPGFFPVALGCILVLAGAAIAVTATLPHESSEEETLPPEWRGWFCIIASLIAFVVIGQNGGPIPPPLPLPFISPPGGPSQSLLKPLSSCRGGSRV